MNILAEHADFPCEDRQGDEVNMRSIPSRWEAIKSPNTHLVVEPRSTPELARAVDALLATKPFSLIVAGYIPEIILQLQDLPPEILRDIEVLASRFASLTGAGRVRIRFEQVVTNSCRKVHADYTDLRLITTYAGPGTQIPPANDPRAETLFDMPTGYVGLFKGRCYSAGHDPCYHRSPPAADMQTKRLVLVIDTETFDDGKRGL